MAKTETNHVTSTNRPSLDSIIAELRATGANRIRVVEEDEDGRRCLDNDEIRLEIGVIYDHWGMKERTRRFLDTVDDTVRWRGSEWSFDATVRSGTAAPRSVLVYDRGRECSSGNGMSVSRLLDVTRE